MISNRSMSRATVIPELAYPDVPAAVAWLCDVFGFTPRIGMGTHRAQINVGTDGSLVVCELAPGTGCDGSHSVMVRVPDVDAHYEHAVLRGACVLKPPMNYPYGERQYNVEDLAGHHWAFSQSIADVDPRDWGGVPGEL